MLITKTYSIVYSVCTSHLRCLRRAFFELDNELVLKHPADVQVVATGEHNVLWGLEDISHMEEVISCYTIPIWKYRPI